jgi:protein-S-isoprenylcysteine O-methyltransferase Ste14
MFDASNPPSAVRSPQPGTVRNPQSLAWGKVAQKLRVPAGTLLGVVFLILMHPSRRSLWIGGFIAGAGAMLRIWAAGHIEKGNLLAEGGPYALTRNPLYLGSFIMAVGILIAGQGYWLLIPFGLFFLSFYYPVMRAEEQELAQRYGERFGEYARKVPLFFPSFTGPTTNPSTFLWSRVIKNREHRTTLGLFFTQLFLLLKSWIEASP